MSPCSDIFCFKKLCLLIQIKLAEISVCQSESLKNNQKLREDE
jgi:hypothetical protein